MNKLLVALCLMTVSAFAQVGIVRSASGIHVPSAKTEPQGTLFVSGSFEMVSDGEPPSVGGIYTDDNGNITQLDNNTPSNDEILNINFSILDNLELWLAFPFHYDGEIRDIDVKGVAFGDFQFMLKIAFPITNKLHVGFSGELIAPTGSQSTGFRPRHRWYITRSGDAYAYTSRHWVFDANTYVSMDFNRVISYNSYAGILKDLSSQTSFLLWGAGLNLFPENRFTLIFEISGETPLHSTNVSDNLTTSPFRITPGLRLHLPYATDFTLSSDIGLNSFKTDNGVPVTLKTGSKDIHYTIAGSPSLTIAASISKRFDLSWADHDRDGVLDRKDLCPGTARGAIVNTRGCPVDEDQDGILNIVDLCPSTPAGLTVDYNGCPLDDDQDGIPNYRDMCPKTTAGAAVNDSGCILDNDNDGVDNNHDQCPATPIGERIGSDGCPLDQDHDGVPNESDQCPDTPKGFSIDKNGCPLDFDGDGIPDEIDKCPNTKLGEAVNEQGCPADSDMDGVPDTRDQCPETPIGVMVNAQGCRLDQDGDGIFDEDDKCPGTPEGAPTDSLGCPEDSDNDGIADWQDQCPGTYPGAIIDNSGCPVNVRHNFNAIALRIRFKANDSTLYNSSYTALNDIIQIMREHPMALEILCSANDDDPTNAQALSTARAEVIYNYLENKGISPKRLKFRGTGAKLPQSSVRRDLNSDTVRLIATQEAQN